MSFYLNKYRVESIRLQNRNYGQGWYFVTICCKNMANYFGKIIQGKVVLSKIGEIARKEWLRVVELRENVILDSWIIMPNHIHGILGINVETHCNASVQDNPRQFAASVQDNPRQFAASVQDNPRQFAVSVQGNHGQMSMSAQENQFGPQKNNLASIVRGFKGSIKRICNQEGFDFEWQARFYESVIKNRQDLLRIRKYIENNPKRCLESSNK